MRSRRHSHSTCAILEHFVEIETFAQHLQKTSTIRSLINTKNNFDKEYLTSFSEDIKQSKSFQEVSLFLDLLQSKPIFSQKVIESMMSLLDGDFLIARRTYYFLSSHNLNAHQLKKVIEFAVKYKEKL